MWRECLSDLQALVKEAGRSSSLRCSSDCCWLSRSWTASWRVRRRGSGPQELLRCAGWRWVRTDPSPAACTPDLLKGPETAHDAPRSERNITLLFIYIQNMTRQPVCLKTPQLNSGTCDQYMNRCVLTVSERSADSNNQSHLEYRD